MDAYQQRVAWTLMSTFEWQFKVRAIYSFIVDAIWIFANCWITLDAIRHRRLTKMRAENSAPLEHRVFIRLVRVAIRLPNQRRNTIELRAREKKEHSRLGPKTSKALMRHTILVKHIYCAIYFISLCAFRKLRHFTAKERNTIFFALFFLLCCS